MDRELIAGIIEEEFFAGLGGYEETIKVIAMEAAYRIITELGPAPEDNETASLPEEQE